MAWLLANLAVIHRRYYGVTIRYGKSGSFGKPEKPSDIARYIEKVAKEYDQERRQNEKELCSELVDRMCDSIGNYTTMEVRAVAHGIPLIFNRAVKDNWLQVISAFTLKRANIMPVYLLYPLVNSICRMSNQQSHIPAEKFMAICIQRINEANSIDLATIAQTALLWRSQMRVKEIMDSIAEATLQPGILEEISATNAVLILYSFAQMGVKNTKLCEELLAVVTKLEHDNFQMHLIPLALHSLARIKCRNEEALKVMVDHALKVVHKMLPENLSSTLHALARLKFNQSALVREAVKRTKELLPSIAVRELSNIFWAIGKLRHDDSELVDSIIDRCLSYEEIDNMSFAQMFEAIRCYHLVGKRDSINELLRRYKKVMKNCSTQIVTQVAWCCCSLGHWEDDIIQKSLEELCSRNRAKKEQKYVQMLLDGLEVRGFPMDNDTLHYVESLRILK